MSEAGRSTATGQKGEAMANGKAWCARVQLGHLMHRGLCGGLKGSWEILEADCKSTGISGEEF